MNKTERNELKGIVRQQFKVLQREIWQRQTEMDAEIEELIAAKFAEADRDWEALLGEVADAVDEANKQIDKALRLRNLTRSDAGRNWIHEPDMGRPKNRDREELRRRLAAQMRKNVSVAQLKLDRDGQPAPRPGHRRARVRRCPGIPVQNPDGR